MKAADASAQAGNCQPGPVLPEDSVEEIYEQASCGYLSTGPDGRIIKVNQTFLDSTGYARDEVLGRKRFEDFLTPAARIFFQSQSWPLLHLQGRIDEVAYQIVTRNGERLPALVNIRQKNDGQGRALVRRITVFNATDRWRYEQELLKARQSSEQSSQQFEALNQQLMDTNAALHAQGERLRVILNSIADGVIATDVAGQVTYLNPVAEAITGRSRSEARGKLLADVLPIGEAQAAALLASATGPAPGLPGHRVARLHRPAGGIAHVTLSAQSMRDAAGELVGAVIAIRDVTEAQEMQARLHFQATHDALTGLTNRSEFERRLTTLLAAPARSCDMLLYLDLDQFKIVNDTCGHAAGDELLRQVATIMQGDLRDNDTLARLGGDEFGVILRRATPEQGMAVAQRLRETVSDFHFVWCDKLFPIGASIGAVLLAPGRMSITDALRVADAACYIAKERGRNRIHLSTADDQAIRQREGEMNWVGHIHEALREQRFVLYTQRLQGLGPDNAAEDHHEVLVRMVDRDGALIAPAAFIPAAERYGLMPQIDRWIVGTVLAHAAANATTYAINLSGATVCDETFLAFVQQSFRDHGTDPRRICFEITETAAIANLRQATALIRELKVMGCRFSLDDFGSGMSSFAYLKHLPVDYLKIDGSFVKDMLDDPVDRAMVESINHIGHVMKLRTVAEFVENDAVLDALREIGVDYAQGYGVQKPVPMGTRSRQAVA